MQTKNQHPEKPPRDSASVVLLRDSEDGLQVLLMRRSTRSRVLGGAYVFPGGKLEAEDGAADTLAQLDRPLQVLHQALGEPQLDATQAAALYVAAIRETAEEAGILLLQTNGQPLPPPAVTETDRWFAALTASSEATLAASTLAPWSRWITPPHQKMIERRFDTRFFLARLPASQNAREDGFELTAAHWVAPRKALRSYYNGDINLIPPQIISLMHLSIYENAQQAMCEARRHAPPLVQPEMIQDGDLLTMCYPGDPRHPVHQRAFPEPVPTRLVMRNGRFEPPQGTGTLAL